MSRILIIQTAFIGDVILATSLIESLAKGVDDVEIDVLVRKGNEGLLKNNPHVNQILIWDKSNAKYANLKKLAKTIRQTKYDVLLNLQRFGSTGYLSWRSRAKQIIGFDKNPFSFCYTHKVKHEIGNGRHEIERNLDLIQQIGDFILSKPKLYPDANDHEKIRHFSERNYYVLAPASVWFTKQLPSEKWIELINKIPEDHQILFIGAPSDQSFINDLIDKSKRSDSQNLAGELNLLQSAALMKNAKRVFVNDSAPLHLASAVNAPVTAFFCSTIPEFGFGPLSDDQKILQIEKDLTCRPCGLHGKSSCPKQHFHCGHKISVTID